MKKLANTKFVLFEFNCRYCRAFTKAIDTGIKRTNGANKITTIDGKSINKGTCLSCRNKFARARNIKRKAHQLPFSTYEHTPRGFIMRKYRNMKARVLGIQKKKHHLYRGLELLDKNDFYKWALNHDTFWQMYRIWVVNNFTRKLCPTVDRKNSKKGYTLDNMHWLTHSANSSRGAKNRNSTA